MRRSFVHLAIIDWCLSTMSPWDSINESPSVGEVTVIKVYVYGCTDVRRAMHQGKCLRFPEPYAIASYRMFSLGSSITLVKEGSITTARECTGTTFHMAGNRPRIIQSKYGVPNNKGTVECSTAKLCACM